MDIDSKSTLDYIIGKFDPEMTTLPMTIKDVNRTIMAQTLSELGFKVGAEIGVAQGHHSEMLCVNNPGLKLYCVDAWSRHPSGGSREYDNRIYQYYRNAQKRLSPYNCILIRKLTTEAAKDFENGSLDFVFIDAGHDFKSVAADICDWSPKVRVGGIVYGHDYKQRDISKDNKGYKGYVREVVEVVQAYMAAKKINPWFVLEDKIKDPIFHWDDPCWMFVRQESDLI